MITVSSCGVKLQEILSGLEKERLKPWRYTCNFVAFLNISFFLSSVHVPNSKNANVKELEINNNKGDD